jgi:hypothetical protein
MLTYIKSNTLAKTPRNNRFKASFPALHSKAKPTGNSSSTKREGKGSKSEEEEEEKGKGGTTSRGRGGSYHRRGSRRQKGNRANNNNKKRKTEKETTYEVCAMDHKLNNCWYTYVGKVPDWFQPNKRMEDMVMNLLMDNKASASKIKKK